MDSRLPENWLDYLPEHPVFASTGAFKTSTQGYKPTFGAPPTEDAHRTRVIAVREHDLLIAVGSQIRIINLNDVKDTWISTAKEAIKSDNQKKDCDKSWLNDIPYKILETPEMNFHIDTLTVNTSGRFLAVAGERQVVVVVLPRQGLSSESEKISRKQRVTCKTLTIGKTIYDSEKETRILKVDWHPLSETQSHILILGDDSRLRMFDISSDIESPEQVFDLAPSQRKRVPAPKRGVFFTDDLDTDEEAVSFSLGGPSKDDSGWEPFTVYYALRAGHIYALCPVLPFKSFVRRQHLESLSCVAHSKIEHVEKKAGHENIEWQALTNFYRLHYQWIYDMLGSVKKLGKDDTSLIDGECVSVRSHKCSIPHQVQRQGPFKIAQDENQSLDIDAQVSDMTFIKTKPVDILAVAFTNGTVRNYILAAGIEAQWLMPTETTQMWKREDWLEKLEKINAIYQQDGQTQEAKDAVASLSQDKGSKVQCLINSAPFGNSSAPMVGLVVVHDLYLSRFLLAISDPSDLVSVELGIRRDLPAEDMSGLASAVADQLKGLAADQRTDNIDDSEYRCMLPLPPFETPSTLAALQGLPNQPRIVVPASMGGSKEVVITEETLLFMSTASAKIQRDIKSLAQTATLIKKRMSLQEDEFKRQVLAMKDLHQRVEKHRGAGSEREEKIRETAQTHAKLALRADALMRQLIQRYQPQLSQHEKAWMEKLEEIQKAVEGDQGYAWRLDKLKSQIELIQAKPKLAVSELRTTITLTKTQAESVKTTLDKQAELLKSTEKRMWNLKEAIGSA
ncbi:hypothetical protein DFQ28_005138 [Apophysomyces sp. BC1034]|nr:hypothetical protein DFQ30_000907 [Apophysomyces sp. BC1015]KAG0180244.1 hypothetical protein DFQ29_000978 [Apophysomyces sp. BC1021]KAG0188281.1 hypothetical protein DFQ28_005138 [Apophysomyces sp. BC1034]